MMLRTLALPRLRRRPRQLFTKLAHVYTSDHFIVRWALLSSNMFGCAAITLCSVCLDRREFRLPGATYCHFMTVPWPVHVPVFRECSTCSQPLRSCVGPPGTRADYPCRPTGSHHVPARRMSPRSTFDTRRDTPRNGQRTESVNFGRERLPVPRCSRCRAEPVASRELDACHSGCPPSRPRQVHSFKATEIGRPSARARASAQPVRRGAR